MFRWEGCRKADANLQKSDVKLKKAVGLCRKALGWCRKAVRMSKSHQGPKAAVKVKSPHVGN